MPSHTHKLTLSPEHQDIMSKFLRSIQNAQTEVQLKDLIQQNQSIVQEMLQGLLLQQKQLMANELRQFAGIEEKERLEAPSIGISPSDPSIRQRAELGGSSGGVSGLLEHPVTFTTGQMDNVEPEGAEYSVEIRSENDNKLENKLTAKARFTFTPSFSNYKQENKDKYKVTVEAPRPVPTPKFNPRPDKPM